MIRLVVMEVIITLENMEHNSLEVEEEQQVKLILPQQHMKQVKVDLELLYLNIELLQELQDMYLLLQEHLQYQKDTILLNTW